MTRRSAQVFEERAAEYDGWFDLNPVFASELLTLQNIQTPLPEPRLEIGVGPGRFAASLGVRFGLDPAKSPLLLARQRRVLPCQAAGEALPVRSGCLGTIFLLFTLCFVEDPRAVFAECRRALRPDGILVIGTVPFDSPWGQALEAKRQAGHPFYRDARFVDLATTLDWLTTAGFTLVESRSALLQPPAAQPGEASPGVGGIRTGAGFVVLVGGKN
jgi:SAM-dependent methyltransferase